MDVYWTNKLRFGLIRKTLFQENVRLECMNLELRTIHKYLQYIKEF